METNKIKISTVIICLAVIVGVEITAGILISRKLLAPLSGLGLTRLAEIILLLIIIQIRQKHIADIGLASSNIYTGLKKGLIWAVSFGAAAGIVLIVTHLIGISVSGLFQMQLPTESGKLIPFFVVGALIGPIAEEIFFRGLLYGFFRRWGIPAAVVLSTLLFVLPHYHTSGASIPVTQFIGGILFAVAYEVEKNLVVPMTIHCLGNLAIFTLALLI